MPENIDPECPDDTFPEKDRAMDDHNNWAGKEAAENGEGCYSGCRDRLYDGRLQVNAPGGYKW